MESVFGSMARRSLGVVILLGTVLASHSARGQEWYESYEKGRTAIQDQRWEDAIRDLSAALNERSQPGANAKTYGLRFIDYFPFAYRGLAYYRTGKLDKALEDLQREENAGEVFKGTSDTEAARIVRDHLALIRQQKTDEVTFSQSVAYYRQNNYRKAIDGFKTIGSNSSFFPEAQRYITMAESELKKEQVAVEPPKVTDVPEAVAVIDQDLTAGIQLFQEKNYDDAEAKFRAVLRRDQNNKEATHYLRLIRAERQKLAAVTTAAPDRRTAKPVQTPPPPPAGPKEVPASTRSVEDSLFQKGLAHYSSGQLSKAQEAFYRFRMINPAYAEVIPYLENITRNQKAIHTGIAAYLEGDYKQTIVYLSEAARLNKENAQLYGFLGSAYATRYYLDGADDRELKDLAREAFQTARELDATYSLDSRYVSPRIIAMFNSR